MKLLRIKFMYRTDNYFDQSAEHCADIATRLHADDSHVIFFVYSNVQSFLFIAKDSTPSWPESVGIGFFQKSEE